MNPAQSFPHNHINLLLPAQINYHGRIFSASLGSLTAEGALLETHALTLPVGMEVELSVTLGRSPWLIKAVITHTTPHEIGILFKQTQHKLYAAARNELPFSFHSTARPTPERIATRQPSLFQ
ncbi:hypothetical protein [Sedimenticola sp.]|uniref:hypothetical protein n=1 Tax=Sedimenticola sp. TaxID=1940285 RepID=UPI003D14572C